MIAKWSELMCGVWVLLTIFLENISISLRNLSLGTSIKPREYMGTVRVLVLTEKILVKM